MSDHAPGLVTSSRHIEPDGSPGYITGPRAPWRRRLHTIIFGHETPAGKAFDVVLIVAILLSVAVVMIDSIAAARARWGPALRMTEFVLTGLFTAEYILRLVSARSASRYATSFFGIIDLLAVLPTYVSLFFPGGQYLIVIRVLRVLRVFRVLKLATYMGEATILARAVRASSRKITVFLFTVMTIVVIVGALLYLVEGPASGFSSIPVAMYWAIVTLTTVGYGDIAPQTPLGQMLASLVMLMGYGIIAVPTGIVTVEIANAAREGARRICPGCGQTGHEGDARFCKSCGTNLTSAPVAASPTRTPAQPPPHP